MTERLSLAAALVNELETDPDELERLRVLLNAATLERRVNAREAADLLQCNSDWLTKAAKAGRVVGAEKVGSRWLFYPSQLKVLPLAPADELTAEGAGRGVRQVGESSTVSAIKNAGRRAA